MTMACITSFSNDTDSRYRLAPKIVAHVSDNAIARLSWATSRHKGIRRDHSTIEADQSYYLGCSQTVREVQENTWICLGLDVAMQVP
jgi:hypothetical protein